MDSFVLIDGLIYHRERHTNSLTVIDREHISLILQHCHEFPYMGHMSEDRTRERVSRTVWWPQWKHEMSESVSSFQRCLTKNTKHGKKYVLIKHIEDLKHPW
ncbi:hypothetical protein O181_016421 [Austropuccinia psidii MF-1]|uniref:Integrase zinc-binding domain-containing protein n=1 Tax=Austropuccinia psidii MF-1 TaxID=1389203 RepID=A0A9Q3C5L5_9BASI|nr:hypothetical protein [Austropuccinia psidii MF-1]